MKLLIVEDDLLLQMGLEKALSKEKYVFDVVSTLKEAEQYVAMNASQNYAAILLDLGLPDGDGVTLLKKWRDNKIDIPTLIMTARDAVEDRIAGLDAGADDYLIKPFELNELLARLRAIIRRNLGQPSNILEAGALSLDLVNKSIQFQGAVLELTVREYAILARLILKYQHVVPREVLLQDLYSWQDVLGSNTLEVYIHRLRQKLGKERIMTVRGVGYQLVEV